jgi:hypothetical protein
VRLAARGKSPRQSECLPHDLPKIIDSRRGADTIAWASELRLEFHQGLPRALSYQMDSRYRQGARPEQKAFAEGGYEPAMSRLAPVSEKIYMREIVELLKQFK